MSEEPGNPKDKEFSYLETEQPAVANTAGCDVNGVQAGVVQGNINFFGASTQGELVFRYATSVERDEVLKRFVEPDGLEAARRALSEHNVVVLCGAGSGRSFAARRLLVELGAQTVADLNPARDLASVRTTELERAAGYVWEADDTVKRPLTDRALSHCAKVIRELGSWLVIVLRERSQSPASGMNCTFDLVPPPPLDVAVAILRGRRPDDSQSVELELKRHLADALARNDPPVKAVLAAELAISIAENDLSPEKALQRLQENVGSAVARLAEGWQVMDYAMSFAVAVLEEQPYDEVVVHALDLERRIREAQLPEDKKLRPRQVFTSPKDILLRKAEAKEVPREHPMYKGQREGTVRFCRQDWAGAVLHHVWEQYPAAHEVLWEWMRSPEVLARFGDAIRRALCIITSDVPAHDPLCWVDGLAASDRKSQRELAVSILVRLADEHRHRPMVEQMLDRWVTNATVNRQWTAAVVYGSVFARADLDNALEKLRKLACSTWSTPKYGVVQGLFTLMTDPDCRAVAVERVLTWSVPGKGHLGPRVVAHSLTMYLAGFSRVADYDPAEFAELYPRQLHTMVRRVLHDQEAGSVALTRMYELARSAEGSTRAATDLVRIARLITPDLRWPFCQRSVLALARCHPGKVSMLFWSLLVARRHQQRARRTAQPAQS